MVEALKDIIIALIDKGFIDLGDDQNQNIQNINNVINEVGKCKILLADLVSLLY